MMRTAGFCSRSKAAAADARHARDLGLQLPASSATGGTATAAAEARRLIDIEHPTPQPPRRPRSERPTKPTLSELWPGRLHKTIIPTRRVSAGGAGSVLTTAMAGTSCQYTAG